MSILDEINKRIHRLMDGPQQSGDIVIYYGHEQRLAICGELRYPVRMSVATISEGDVTYLFGCRVYLVNSNNHLNVARMS